MNETIFAAPEQSTVQIEEIFFSWLLTMVACWTWSAGYEVAESGADLDLVSFASFIFSSCIFIIMKRRTFWTKIWWYWFIVINTYFHLPSSNTRTFWWCRTIRYQPPTKELTFYHDFASQSTADVPLLMTIFSSRVGFCNKVELTKYYYNLSGKPSRRKKMFSFGHCPNYLPPPYPLNGKSVWKKEGFFP